MSANALNRIVKHLRRAALDQDGSGRTDGQLLERFIAERDETAVEILLRRHGPMVLGVCRRVLRDSHDAEDAFQATFLVLVRKAGTIKPREMVGNWLYGVAHQTALRARIAGAKRRARERQVTDMPEPNTARAESGDLLPLLDQELSRLPAKYRSAIVLCDLEGKSYKEAARQLACPEGTLSARLTRGRALLAKRLKKHGLAVAAATGALWPHGAATAGVPPALATSTLNVVNSAAGTAAATAALVAPQVAALTEGVLKAMLLAKLKMMAVVLAGAILIAASAGVALKSNAAGPGDSNREASAQTKKEEDDSRYLVRVSSQFEGILQFVATEIKEGEAVPAGRIVTVEIGGEKKKFRRLRKGDKITEGQLLAGLDDRLARADLAVKKQKHLAADADSKGAKLIAAEADIQFQTKARLFNAGALPQEEYRTAKLTKEKMWLEALNRQETEKVAEMEVKQAQAIIDAHEVRSRVKGVVANIRKRPGEGVRKFETVLEIEVTEEK
jgi:RNA polymerase sigma factor (sigma-70 family)